MSKYKWKLAALTLACTILAGSSAFGARVSDIRATEHNLSAENQGTPTRTGSVPDRLIKATGADEVCVFCHTPHAALSGNTPLWNKKLSSATYTPYSSASLDAQDIKGGVLDQPGGSSKLCLSCHDGTVAVGAVNVLNGAANQSISMTGGSTMPARSGVLSGYTRNLGVDLTNDHPISVDYTSALALRDGELRNVDANQKWPNGSGEIIGVRGPGYKPMAPLETPVGGGPGQIQCATCHDAHLRETDASVGNQKFLRLNRFQESFPKPPGSPFEIGTSTTGDINCVACHDKGYSYPYSIHASPDIAKQTYTGVAANEREFPVALPMWKASCLNCHDTHTAQGARILLRNATDSKGFGGRAANEETCYQCHSAGSSVVTPVNDIADIQSAFELPIRMPITTADQRTANEAHEIGGRNSIDPGGVNCNSPNNKCGADFVETRDKLGLGNPSNRHAECSDCHNPHRMVKFPTYWGNFSNKPDGSWYGFAIDMPPGPNSKGTHAHTDTPGWHSNAASGVLRGTTGVEPQYGSHSFQSMPISYDVKRGDPGTKIELYPTYDTNFNQTSATYVTREYQICLKCHSNYAYNDNNAYPNGSRPSLGYMGGGTLQNTNGLTVQTNQAKEFQAPLTHKGDLITGTDMGIDGGAAAAYNTNNRRSWHPVMDSTGRTGIERKMDQTAGLTSPWDSSPGYQTMYCSDCHSASTAYKKSTPQGNSPWGPHGSQNNFLLIGTWNKDSGTGDAPQNLCYKCHKTETYLFPTAAYGSPTGTVINSTYGASGFAGPLSNNLHSLHNMRILEKTGYTKLTKCAWCHVAVPHGWKNKGLLVNLNDVGPEGGKPIGTVVPVTPNTGYNQEPYYMNAMNYVTSFAKSGNWTANDCGGVAWMQTNCSNPQ